MMIDIYCVAVLAFDRDDRLLLVSSGREEGAVAPLTCHGGFRPLDPARVVALVEQRTGLAVAGAPTLLVGRAGFGEPPCELGESCQTSDGPHVVHFWHVYRAHTDGVLREDAARTRSTRWYRPTEYGHMLGRSSDVPAPADALPHVETTWLRNLRDIDLGPIA